MLGGIAAAVPALAAEPQAWPFSGGNIQNTRSVRTKPGPEQLAPNTVGQLQVKWTFRTHSNVSATPTVEPGGLYVPDWAGYLYKLDPRTGALIWQHRISDYSGNPASFSRGSPAISATSIVFGDRGGGGWVYAVAKSDGALLWATQVNPHPVASVTAAPVIYGDTVYVGVASREETLAVTTSYQPTFRGNLAALDLATGHIRWSFTTVPEGYSGGGVVGSNPAISPTLGLIFFGAGNNYSIPAELDDCVTRAGRSQPAQLACLDPTDYVDSIIALDLRTGALAWSRRLGGADTWTNGCYYADQIGCPSPRGADSDFGSAPNLLDNEALTGVPDDRGGTGHGVLLGAGQKSGIYWGLNPENGGIFWSRKLGNGDIQWGSAGGSFGASRRVFVALNNTGHSANRLAGRLGVPVTWSAGSWGALDTATGAVDWQVPASPADLVNPQLGANTPGPMTYTNQLVFAGDSGGNLVALSAATGYRFWTFATGATVGSGPAIFDNTLYWGVGYPRGIPGHTLYAFGLPPK